jgi:hypothetical protein
MRRTRGMNTRDAGPRHRAGPGGGGIAELDASAADSGVSTAAPRRLSGVRGERPSSHEMTPRVSRMSAVQGRQRLQLAVLITIWIALTVYFWSWWLTPSHIGNPLLFAVVSASFLYIATILPSFYIFYLTQMRHPVLPPAPQGGGRLGTGDVAVITLTVPGSESLDIVERQLAAMAAVRHPHGSWVLVDTMYSPEIEQLTCDALVRYFSRHDAGHWFHPGRSAVGVAAAPRPLLRLARAPARSRRRPSWPLPSGRRAWCAQRESSMPSPPDCANVVERCVAFASRKVDIRPGDPVQLTACLLDESAVCSQRCWLR